MKTDADLLQYQGAEFLFIGWEELTQFTYSQWDFLKGSNRCPIKTYEHKGRMYATRPRMAGGTNPNGKGSGWVKALWITKKPVGEMAAKYEPTEYEAIHSTYEDNLVYRDDANYIASLKSIVDPVLRQAWIPGSWDILAGQFFQNWDPERHVKSFGQCVFESWQPRWISIDWGFEHSTVALWWTRVRIKTDLDQKAERTVLLCYRQLVMRQMNEQLVAERIAAANHTGDKSDPIQHIYLSPDRFSKIDQYHSIADKMGDNELFLDVCESFRYGVMSYGSEQVIPREVEMQRIIQAIPDNTQKYQRYLELTSRNPANDLVFTIPRRRWFPGRRW